jgi:hypothetical protein
MMRYARMFSYNHSDTGSCTIAPLPESVPEVARRIPLKPALVTVEGRRIIVRPLDLVTHSIAVFERSDGRALIRQ